VSLYYHTLLAEPRALAYLASRGLDTATIERCRLGYAPGNQLTAFMRWHRLPIGPALRVGLLTRGGAEFLAGRIVVPDLNGRRPQWLIGRRLDDNLPDDAPVHLGLPGTKPLLGLDDARRSPTVIVVEGSFDQLTLNMWAIRWWLRSAPISDRIWSRHCAASSANTSFWITTTPALRQR
jgi:DNA primase